MNNIRIIYVMISISLLYTVTCDLPSQLLAGPVTINVEAESRVIPYGEGEFITYMCILSGHTLTGPNTSVCTGNGEWEPDPVEVDCIGDNANFINE